MANFGGIPGPSKLETLQSYRFVIFTSLLAGTVVWIGYRASLTSELSAAKKKLPFNDLESLLNTEYRLTTHEAGNAFAGQFITASQGSIFQKLQQNNMDSDSYLKKYEGFESLLVNPKETRFLFMQDLLSTKKYKCKVVNSNITCNQLSEHIFLLLQFLTVWKSPLPIFFDSIAITKGSPYGLFMANAIHQMTEKGQLNWMKSKFKYKTQDCKNGLATAKPLGLKKISFPFFVAMLGFLLSGLTCMCERIFWTPKLTMDCQTQVNHSKAALQSEIGHLKSVLSQGNAFKWDWLDEFMVKIQDSHVNYHQLNP
jgi:hypothetical protein